MNTITSNSGSRVIAPRLSLLFRSPTLSNWVHGVKRIGALWTKEKLLTGSSGFFWPKAMEKLVTEDSTDTLDEWTKQLRSERFSEAEQAFLDRHVGGIVNDYYAEFPNHLDKEPTLRRLLEIKDADPRPRCPECKDYTKQITACYNPLDYSLMTICYVCRMAYPMGYITEAMVKKNCFNPPEL